MSNTPTLRSIGPVWPMSSKRAVQPVNTLPFCADSAFARLIALLMRKSITTIRLSFLNEQSASASVIFLAPFVGYITGHLTTLWLNQQVNKRRSDIYIWRAWNTDIIKHKSQQCKRMNDVFTQILIISIKR